MMHLVLSFVLMTVTGACPIMCACFQQLPTPNIYCNNTINITTNNFDTNRQQHLIINGFNASELQVFIDQLPSVDRLNFNELTIIKSYIGELINLENFTTIQTIHLNFDRFENLTKTLSNFSFVKNLDLSQNNLIEIDSNQPFRTFDQLETLNLSGNSLIELNQTNFFGLSNLKCLDLSINNLTTISTGLFNNLTLLQYLNLSNNHLIRLNDRLFNNLLKLQQLDVSYNHLKRIEFGSFQLPSLARLLLSNNYNLGNSSIDDEPIILVGNGQRLQIVDASNIGLKQVPAALTHSIRTLRLTNNQIKYINCGDFDSYPILQLLDLKANNLEIIEDDALGRLDCLNILYLSNNRICEIPKSLPEKLKILHLESNRIETITSHDLQNLPLLEVLLLNDNKITLIENGAFQQLFNLITLDLSRNPIKSLTTDCLAGPTNLQILRLSNIGVKQPIQDVTFPLSTIEHLIILDLSKSIGLTRQLLADTAALAASHQLQELDLSYTNLERLRSDLFDFLPQLRLLHLNGNRFDCKQLYWLSVWMRRQDLAEYRQIICFKPPELWGSLLIDLQSNDESTINLEKIGTTTTTTDVVLIDNDWINLNSSHIFDHNHQWNSSTGEMSMFSMADDDGGGGGGGGNNKVAQPHPGMLILIGGILSAILILTILTRKLTKKHWATMRLLRQQNNDLVEINNLPGVTELW